MSMLRNLGWAVAVIVSLTLFSGCGNKETVIKAEKKTDAPRVPPPPGQK